MPGLEHGGGARHDAWLGRHATRGGNSARLLRMPSRMSIDARLPRTNREVQSDLNDTESSMASAQRGDAKHNLNETCLAQRMNDTHELESMIRKFAGLLAW